MSVASSPVTALCPSSVTTTSTTTCATWDGKVGAATARGRLGVGGPFAGAAGRRAVQKRPAAGEERQGVSSGSSNLGEGPRRDSERVPDRPQSQSTDLLAVSRAREDVVEARRRDRISLPERGGGSLHDAD